MKILLLGSEGQLGRCISNKFNNSHYELVDTNRSNLDITENNRVFNFFKSIKPQIVINAAAYAAVDDAESNFSEANKINNLAVSNISKACLDNNSLLIHVSTDYVFDGATNTPYLENDKTNPINVYGKTKLLGEEAIKNIGCKHIIIRTSWLFSQYGKNFLKTMIDLSSARKELNIINDQFGCPTYAPDLAEAIKKIIDFYPNKLTYGTYHFAGDQPCSWADFAEKIFEIADKKNFINDIPKIIPVGSDHYITSAKRPKNSILNSNLIKKEFNIDPSDWKDGIRKAILKF
ncbi:MAG: dTDP-4-dehydrorhamnose reductase [Gammaproteobacteria bacterium]